jgi:hypothetical protein
MNNDKCPICGGELTTYKTKHVGTLTRRLRRCKEQEKCGYREVMVVRVTEQVLERRPMAG